MKHEIYKANSIISNTNVELSSKITLQDERYINICLSRVFKKELLDKDTWYGIDVNMYSQASGVSKRHSYDEIRRIATTLREAKVVIPQGNGVFIETGWINSILYDENNYTLAVKWNEKVIPFISGFTEGNYTIIDSSAAKLVGINSYKLYEIIKRELYRESFTIGISELQEMLGLKYPTYGNLKQAVLVPAQKDIHHQTDLRYKVSENKIGRKVESLTFYDLYLIDLYKIANGVKA